MARAKRRPFQPSRPERQRKDLVYDDLIFPRFPRLAQLLFQLFGPLKLVNEVEPVPLHPADGAPGRAEQFGIAVEEVIKIHTSEEYLIYMIGFIAGFPYLGGMSKEIATPRLKSPRVKIEGGSVGIAGEQTGIYPVASPGGWQLIGRTPLKLYDADREKPVLLEAGQYIKFAAVTEEEYKKIEKEVEDGTYKYVVYDKEV